MDILPPRAPLADEAAASREQRLAAARLQDVDDWACELRTVEIPKGGHQLQFCRFIEKAWPRPAIVVISRRLNTDSNGALSTNRIEWRSLRPT